MPCAPFEQDACTGAALVVQDLPDAIHVGKNLIRNRGQFFHDGVVRHFGMAEPAAQRIVMGQQPVHLRRQRIEAGKVHDTNGATPDLVLIGRPDASARRADLGSRARCRILAESIELAVQRKDKRGVLGDLQPVRRNIHALRPQLADFRDKGMRVEDDTIADDRQLAVAHDA